jgi:hypothetical protein
MSEHTITVRHDPTFDGEARLTVEDGRRVLTFGAKDPEPSATSIVALMRAMADA